MSDTPSHPWHMVRREDGAVQCSICPHRCTIASNDIGRCGVRGNRNGAPSVPLSARIGQVELLSVEQFGLYHFYPGRAVQSADVIGCAVDTERCSPWAVGSSHARHAVSILPDELVDNAVENDASIIGLGGGEPALHAEYVLELASATQKSGHLVIGRSSGFMERHTAHLLSRSMSALIIDLPFFDRTEAERQLGVSLHSVLDTLETLSSAELHTEVSLHLPADAAARNESGRQLFSRLAELNAEMPLHLAFPHGRAASALELYDTAKQYLDYVYAAAPVHAEDTLCPVCDAALIERSENRVSRNALRRNRCPKCNRAVPGRYPDA